MLDTALRFNLNFGRTVPSKWFVDDPGSVDVDSDTEIRDSAAAFSVIGVAGLSRGCIPEELC
jgi:hypothetical protein